MKGPENNLKPKRGQLLVLSHKIVAWCGTNRKNGFKKKKIRQSHVGQAQSYCVLLGLLHMTTWRNYLKGICELTNAGCREGIFRE